MGFGPAPCAPEPPSRQQKQDKARKEGEPEAMSMQVD